MPLFYKFDGVKGQYLLSYSELRADYVRFCLMSDDEFIQSLPRVLHFACVVCWVKEVGADATLSDEGVIHRLVHLLDGVDEGNPDGVKGGPQQLDEVRRLFNELCCLA